MRRAFWALVCLFFLAKLSGIAYTPKQMLVKTKSSATVRGTSFGSPKFDAYLGSLHVKKIEPITKKNDNRYYTVTVEDSINWTQLKARESFPGIEYIQPNYLNKMTMYPDDPYFSNQHFDLAKLPQAWDISTGNNQIIVGIIDSGIAFDHPDLQTHIYENEREIPANGLDDDHNGYIDDVKGWDFADAPELADIALGDYLDQDNDASDENWHGTHVAGIIAGDADNSRGICGICWSVRIMPLRAGFRTTSGNGYLQDDDVAEAIIYAADMGADVINASWGDENFSQIIADACQYAYDRGTIIVAAAGNTPVYGVNYPARLATVIAVGAIDNNYNLAGFSSYGAEIDLVAPGQEILSTWDPSQEIVYQTSSGTSMAAPFVSGSIALLLSVQPGLSFQEVLAKLAYSATDLGEPGRDIYFGYGVVNSQQLLLNQLNSNVNISYPLDHMPVKLILNEFDQPGFDLLGTAKLDDFFEYTVTYSRDVTNLDFYDVTTHRGTPEDYFTEVENGKLAHFTVPDGFPDGDYIIKLTVKKQDGSNLTRQIQVTIDQSKPIFRNQDCSLQERFEGEKANFYLHLGYNEPVNATLRLKDGTGQTTAIFSTASDSSLFISLPAELPEDIYGIASLATNRNGEQTETNFFDHFINNPDYALNGNISLLRAITFPEIIFQGEEAAVQITFSDSCSVRATYSDPDGHEYSSVSLAPKLTHLLQIPSNLLNHPFAVIFRIDGSMGVTSETENYRNYIEIKHKYTDIHSYTQTGVAAGMVPITATYDFDGNQTEEIIAMNFNNAATGPVGAYEYDGSTLNKIYNFAEEFWPRDLGNTNASGMEILATKLDTALLYETIGSVSYPNVALWNATGAAGVLYGDYDLDGFDEVFVIQNVNSRRVVSVFNRAGNNLEEKISIQNNTDTNERNTFVPTMVLDDFNRNGVQELLCADTDGDAIIYEISPGNTVQNIWQYRMEVPNVYFLCKGDFNGDGQIDFCLGGYYDIAGNREKTYWSFGFFSYQEGIGYYRFGDMSFETVGSNNAIMPLDLDGDGDSELIFALTPHLYVVDYRDRQFVPIYSGTCDKNFQLTGFPAKNGNSGLFFVNNTVNGNLLFQVVKKAAAFQGPLTPVGFRAKALSSNAIELNWNRTDNAQYYNVYRKVNSITDKIGETAELSYYDTQVREGLTYEYYVTAVNQAYSPSESMPSVKKTCIPIAPPVLLKASIAQEYILRLLFDKPLDDNALQTGHYLLNPGNSRPQSVEFFASKKGLLLRFCAAVPQEEGSSLILNNLMGETGVLMPTEEIEYDFLQDMEAPYLVKASVLNSKEVEVEFSEPIDADQGGNIDNYGLILPAEDIFNGIGEVDYNTTSNTVKLSFISNLKPSNEDYFLIVRNISDLAGNGILNSANKIRFSLTPIEGLKYLEVYPNPTNFKETDKVIFARLPINRKGEIKIYDLAGVLVFEDTIPPLTKNGASYSWAGVNKIGKKVASGMYFFVIKMGHDVKKGKIGIIR